MSVLKTIAAAYAGKEAFKLLIQDVYRFLSDKTSGRIKQWNTEKKIDALYRKISNLRKVKTIWQIDKAIDLTSFYCDSHITLDKKRLKIEKLSDFPISGNILIQGIAGQGKSIFLRYLCCTELAMGNYIPLFLELRRVGKNQTLYDRIYASFESLGLSVDEQLFDTLASSGKILLLLDAFDEIPEEFKSKVITDIEDLANKKDKLQIVVTSRPSSGIEVSPHFQVVTLDNLQGNEYKDVINRLASGQSWSNSLIKHIEHKASHIKDMLCTPLMVTLLVLSYKSYQQLPTRLSEFYDSLFFTLLQRHDGTKPGFTRERACQLDDAHYRYVFETLCILAKKAGESSFSYNGIHKLVTDAIKQNNLHENSDSYLKDIVKITCLILRDGEEYRYIHKTVQEYYSAAFIKRKPDIWAKEFYKKMLDRHRQRGWSQELSFLSEIDDYRYNKYFFLPAILKFLRIKENDLFKKKMRRTTLKDAHRVLGAFSLRLHKTKTKEYGLSLSVFQRPVINIIERMIVDKIFRMDYRPLHKLAKEGVLDSLPIKNKEYNKMIHQRERDNMVAVFYDQLFDSKIMTESHINLVDELFSELSDIAKNILKSLQDAENKAILGELL
jgi:hypothetical protein